MAEVLKQHLNTAVVTVPHEYPVLVLATVASWTRQTQVNGHRCNMHASTSEPRLRTLTAHGVLLTGEFSNKQLLPLQQRAEHFAARTDGADNILLLFCLHTDRRNTNTHTLTKWKTCLAVILLAQLNGTDPVKCERFRVQIYTWRHSRMSKTSLACFLLSRICWALLLRSTLALFARFSVLFPELTLRFLAGAMFTG